MGIGSYDVTGDGYPDVYLTSQGPNVLQTLLAGPVAADLPRHRDQAWGRPRTRPSTGGDPLPSTAWHPEFAGRQQRRLRRPVRLEGQRRHQPDYATQGPVRPVPRPARTGRSSRPPRPRGSSTSSAAAAPRSPTSTSMACPISSRSIYGAPVRIWRNVGAGGSRGAGPHAATGSTCGRPSRPRTAMPSAPGSRSRSATPRSRRELTVGGGHAGGQLGWSISGSGRRPRREVRVTWPDGTVGPWHRRLRRTSSSIDRPRDATRARPWPPLRPMSAA